MRNQNYAKAAALAIIHTMTIVLNETQVTHASDHNQQQPQTPDQLIEQYACTPNDTRASKPRWQKLMFGDECARDSSSWRFNYVNELQEPYSVRVKENLIDERLANMIDTVRYMKTRAPFTFDFNAGDSSADMLNQHLVAGPQVDDRVCGEHLKQMLALIQDLDRRLAARRQDPESPIELHERDIHLARVLDSFGRYDSGFFSGQFRSMGDHDQCVGSQLMLNENGQDKLVGARYCWAQFNLEKHLHPTLNRNKEKFSKYIYKRNILSAGICIPESCHSKSFAANRQLFQQLASEQFKLPKSMYLNDSLELESIFCLVDEKSDYLKWSLGAILFVVTLSGWTLLTICVTVYCKKIRRQDKQVPSNLLVCLDLSQSWNDLLGNKPPQTSHGHQNIVCRCCSKTEPKKAVNLDAISCVKVSGWLLMVLGHSLSFLQTHANNLLRGSMLANYNSSTTVVKIYFSIVDTFFVIGGMLVGYSALKRFEMSTRSQSSSSKSQSKCHLLFTSWFTMSISRYFRMVPVLFLLFWFEKSLFNRLGSGPLWDHGLDKDTMAGACRETSWLRPFDIFSNSLAGFNCIPPAWFVYSDLFAHIIFVPPLAYMLAIGYTKLVYLITIGLTAISTLVVFLQHAYILDPALDQEIRQMRSIEMTMRTELSTVYTTHYHRVPPVLFGLLAGHALRRYARRSANQNNNNNNQKHTNDTHETTADGKQYELMKLNCDHLAENDLTIDHPSQQSIVPSNREIGSSQCGGSNWPAWFRGPATYLASFFLIQMVVLCASESLLRQYLGESFNQSGAILFMYMAPLVWCISNAIILLRLTTDWQDNWFARMGSNQLVKSMNKLGFGIYLFHWYPFVYAMSITRTTIQLSDWMMYSTFGMVYFYTTLLALLVFVLIENPLAKLTRKLIPS